MAAELRGAYPVMVTPMNENYSVDYEGLRSNIDHFVESGVRGLIALGSTGEFASLTREERLKVAEVAVEHVDGRVPVIVGTSSEATAETIEYTRSAASIGASAAMVLPPYYCKPLEDEILEHFASVAEASPIPVMIYNNPGTTGVDVSEDVVVRLATEFETIAYIKESSGDVRRIRNILLRAGDSIVGFCGMDDLAIESWDVGALGWVSVVGNIVPDLVTRMFECIVEEERREEGWSIYRRILPLCRSLEEGGKLVQVAKAALNLTGRAAGPARPPRQPLKRDEEAELSAILSDLGLLPGS